MSVLQESIEVVTKYGKLTIPTDDRVKLVIPGELGEVATELIEHR